MKDDNTRVENELLLASSLKLYFTYFCVECSVFSVCVPTECGSDPANVTDSAGR